MFGLLLWNGYLETILKQAKVVGSLVLHKPTWQSSEHHHTEQCFTGTPDITGTYRRQTPRTLPLEWPGSR